jgi:hypothetical protein
VKVKKDSSIFIINLDMLIIIVMTSGEQDKKTKKLLILGMHRSGTSLTANWISKCNLQIGYELSVATPSNPLGHFEDIDVLDFHERLLKYNNTNMYYAGSSDLKYNDYHVAKAKGIVYGKDLLDSEWGWKQPRACLFLGLWDTAIPDAYYLMIFRDYREVTASLYHRELNKVIAKNGDVKGFEEKKDQTMLTYLTMWNIHNERLVKHAKERLERILVISFDYISECQDSLIPYINKHWGFHLTNTNPSTVFQTNLVTKKQPYCFPPEATRHSEYLMEELSGLYAQTLSRLIVE